MKLLFSVQSFEKKNIQNIKFHENPSSGSRDVPCGRTDEANGHFLAILQNAPSNFSKNFCYRSLMMALCGRNTLCVLKFNPLSAKLNPICHLLALLGAHHILHVSRVRVKKPVLKRVVTDGLYLAFFTNVTRACLK